MQLRIKLWIERKTRELGTLVCGKCTAKHLYALYEGGVCQRCYVPGKFVPPPEAPTPAPARDNWICPSLPETPALQSRVEQLLTETGTSKHCFARICGIAVGRFYKWRQNQVGAEAQREINQKIRIGIAQHFAPKAQGPKPKAFPQEVSA